MQFEYGLDERPPLFKSILLGLQWAVIAIPLLIIPGRIICNIQYTEPAAQIIYLQKMFFVTALTLFFQVLLGHRLTLICGPATVLLIGVIASQGFEPNVIYSSVMAGGLVLTILAVTGLFSHLQRLFTSRVVAVVLLLIAFTLAPTILKLIVGGKGEIAPLGSLIFALALVSAMFLLHRYLVGVWKSTLIIWSMILGSISHFLIFSHGDAVGFLSRENLLSGFLSQLTLEPSFEPGVLISFLFCYLALSVNDLGSIQSMGALLKPEGMGHRISRGVTLTGLANVAAGFFGVIGPVNFSLSPGVVASTGCASRFTLIPASAIICVLAFFPVVIGIIGSVPPVVVGCVLLYVLTSQVAAGLMVVLQGASGSPFQLEDGLVIGFPILLGTVVAFFPPAVLDTFPVVFKPILGNGFVVGVVFVLALEHLVFKQLESC